MAQFDVYRNVNRKTATTIPYLLNVQADLLESLVTRAVVPLVLASEMSTPAKGLNPKIEIEGAAVIMSTAELAGISVRVLGERVTSLKRRRQEIMAALDLLFTGI
jgi:toxin CcdB